MLLDHPPSEVVSRASIASTQYTTDTTTNIKTLSCSAKRIVDILSAHEQVILDSLKNTDNSIKKRALDFLFNLCIGENVKLIVNDLKDGMDSIVFVLPLFVPHKHISPNESLDVKETFVRSPPPAPSSTSNETSPMELNEPSDITESGSNSLNTPPLKGGSPQSDNNKQPTPHPTLSPLPKSKTTPNKQTVTTSHILINFSTLVQAFF